MCSFPKCYSKSSHIVQQSWTQLNKINNPATISGSQISLFVFPLKNITLLHTFPHSSLLWILLNFFQVSMELSPKNNTFLWLLVLSFECKSLPRKMKRESASSHKISRLSFLSCKYFRKFKKWKKLINSRMQTNTEENKTVCLPLKKGKLHTEMCASFSVIMHLSETEN